MVRAQVASSERIATWAAGIGGLLLAAPILAARYPPMGDLAMHEGLIAIMRHLHDPSWVPAGLYYVVAPQANQLFPIVALALSFVFPTDVACKVLVAAIVLATPVLAARLLTRVGRSRWLALLAGPLACGWMFRWGLVANLLGFALLLFALPELERLARRPSPGTIARTVAWTCALFLAHESSALLFALAAGLFALLRSRAPRPFLARMAPVGVAAALALLQWRVSEQLLGANMRAIGTGFGAEPMDRLILLPGAVFGGLGEWRLAAIGGVWIAAIASSVLLGASASRPRHQSRAQPLGVALWRYRYALLAALLFLAYFAFPMSVGGTTLLAHRFLPPACICLAVACARRSTPLVAIILAVACPLVTIGVETRAFVASDAEYRALDRLIALIPRDVAVAQLDLTPRGPGRVAPVPAAAGRVLAERGGRMLFAMTDMPPNPVYVRPGLSWNEPTQRLATAPYAFMPAYDLTRFSYLLERNESESERSAVARALAAEADVVASEGEWTLFHSRLDVAPLDAPDRLPPSPAPETLGARMTRSRAPSTTR
jgi:hypothetical protein